MREGRNDGGRGIGGEGNRRGGEGWGREGRREGGREEAMMLCRERASVEEERVDEGNEQGRDATEHGRQEGKMGGRKRAEDGLSEEGREHGSKGERQTSREVVYSQTNPSQTGPCP